jgi:hypothetical protein
MNVDKPKRIQLSRKRGWRLPLNTVVVSRPSKWGNPFKVHKPTGDPTDLMDAQQGVCFSREAAVKRFTEWLKTTLQWQFEIRRELRGKNLACWCPLDKPCHADVLLKIANGREFL